jgi:hypothetical protein
MSINRNEIIMLLLSLDLESGSRTTHKTFGWGRANLKSYIKFQTLEAQEGIFRMSRIKNEIFLRTKIFESDAIMYHG